MLNAHSEVKKALHSYSDGIVAHLHRIYQPPPQVV
jgi:hypothetical protein